VSLRGAGRSNPLPTGAVSVGVGLLVGGLAQYGFLSVVTHALGATRAAPLATFWALLFIAGPGFFLPLEQEVSRALAARRAQGLGGRPVVLRAGVAGLAVAGCLMLAAALASGPIDSRLFKGDTWLGWALVAGLAAYYFEHLSRGTLAGNGRFSRYGVLLSSEGILRVVLCAGLAILGAKTAGPFGAALVVGSFAAVGIALAGQRGLLEPGPHAAWREISSAIGFLLVASVMTQFLLSVGTVAVQLLASPAQQGAASRFLSSRIVAYVPLFLFQAVQATLLPKLAAFAGAGNFADYRRTMRQILLLVAAIDVVSVVGITALGPWGTRLLFGRGFELSSFDFLLLSTSSAVFVAAQALSQALISLRGYAQIAAAWLSGAIVFVVVTALGSQLFRRVETGLLAASVVCVGMMVALIVPLLRRRMLAPRADPAPVAISQALPEV